MLLIKPSFTIEQCDDGMEILKRIERAGRTCYKSEDKITDDSAVKFASMIIKRGHESVLEHEKITVRIICDRGITHEIVRHRLASYSQESTRYCNYKGGVTFIIPSGMNVSPGEVSNRVFCNGTDATMVWRHVMSDAEVHYQQLINLGWTPQQARSVLPNSVKTEIVMTANLREWRWFFKKRADAAAHPDMQAIAYPMLEEFRKRVPVIFDII